MSASRFDTHLHTLPSLYDLHWCVADGASPQVLQQVARLDPPKLDICERAQTQNTGNDFGKVTVCIGKITPSTMIIITFHERAGKRDKSLLTPKMRALQLVPQACMQGQP